MGHAGESYWQGHEHINDTSIGIEFVNPAFEVNAENNDIVWTLFGKAN